MNRFFPLTAVSSLLLLSHSPSTFVSAKKGVSYASSNTQCADLQTLKGIEWYYNWSEQDPCPNSGSEFIPMVWGSGALAGISTMSKSSQYLLGFNEPNFASQSNLSPSVAASYWPQLVATGKTLISPAMSTCFTSGSGGCNLDPWSWLTQFFTACGSNCKVDYIALHSYTCDVETVLGFVDTAWNNYGRPVWFTEIACDQDELTGFQFAKQIIPLLDAHPHVARYSWFASRTSAPAGASLLDVNAGTLTNTGSFYSSFASTGAPLLACVPTAPVVQSGPSFPTVVPNTGSFLVAVQYGVMNTSVIKVDMVGSVSPNWYGGGQVTVSRGTGIYLIPVTIQGTLPSALTKVTLSLWTVDALVFKNNVNAWQHPDASHNYDVSINTASGATTTPAPVTESALLSTAVTISCVEDLAIISKGQGTGNSGGGSGNAAVGARAIAFGMTAMMSVAVTILAVIAL